MSDYLKAPHTRARMIGPPRKRKPRVKPYVFTPRQLQIALAVLNKQLDERAVMTKEKK